MFGINRDNFILYFSGALGSLVVLAAVLLSVQWVTTTPTSLPSEAQFCGGRLYLQRLTPCPAGDCQKGSSPVIYRGEENVEMGIFADTAGRPANAVGFALNYVPQQLSSFAAHYYEVDPDGGGLVPWGKEPDVDLAAGRIIAYYFSFGGVAGADIPLMRFVLTPASRAEKVEFDFDYVGCGTGEGSTIITEADGDILADPGTVTFVVQPYPTATSAPTATPTSTPTPMPTSTPTPTPTSTPTPTPTPTLSPGACTPDDLGQCAAPASSCTAVTCDASQCAYPTLAYKEPCPDDASRICIEGWCCLNAIDYAGSEGHCDGKISAIDFQNWLAMFREYILADTDAEREAVYQRRADLNSDGKISALDFPEFVRLWRASQ